MALRLQEIKQFICTFNSAIQNDCFSDTGVCRLPFSVEDSEGNDCGCPAYNSLRPTKPIVTNSPTPVDREAQAKRVIGGYAFENPNKWPFFATFGECLSSCVPHGPKGSKTCVGEITKGTCASSNLRHLCGATILTSQWVVTGNWIFALNAIRKLADIEVFFRHLEIVLIA